MTVTCSCGEYAAVVEEQFGRQRAADDLAAYRGKGPGATTKLLRDGLVAGGAIEGSLLDVGAGVGVLTFELLARGVTRATSVDASAAYVAAATEEAARRGCGEAIRFVHGDFLQVAPQLPPATIVTL